MALHARKIVREEFEKARAEMAVQPYVRPVWNITNLATLRARILDRITKECIEQPEPEGESKQSGCPKCRGTKPCSCFVRHAHLIAQVNCTLDEGQPCGVCRNRTQRPRRNIL